MTLLRGNRYARARRVRHVPGQMNASEERYSEHLDLCKHAKTIMDWRFEPMKLRLADKTYLTVDFLVVANDLTIELHEYKGHWEEDARVKVKVAAERYPFFRFLAVTEPKRGDYRYEEFCK